MYQHAAYQIQGGQSGRMLSVGVARGLKGLRSKLLDVNDCPGKFGGLTGPMNRCPKGRRVAEELVLWTTVDGDVKQPGLHPVAKVSCFVS